MDNYLLLNPLNHVISIPSSDSFYFLILLPNRVARRMNFFQKLNKSLLCISTSKRVLNVLFAFWNQLFVFFANVSVKSEKKEETCNKKVKIRLFWSFLAFYHLFFKMWKYLKMLKSMILTSKWHVKHKFAGQNTKQIFVLVRSPSRF